MTNNRAIFNLEALLIVINISFSELSSISGAHGLLESEVSEEPFQ